MASLVGHVCNQLTPAATRVSVKFSHGVVLGMPPLAVTTAAAAPQATAQRALTVFGRSSQHSPIPTTFVRPLQPTGALKPLSPIQQLRRRFCRRYHRHPRRHVLLSQTACSTRASLEAAVERASSRRAAPDGAAAPQAGAPRVWMAFVLNSRGTRMGITFVTTNYRTLRLLSTSICSAACFLALRLTCI